MMGMGDEQTNKGFNEKGAHQAYKKHRWEVCWFTLKLMDGEAPSPQGSNEANTG